MQASDLRGGRAVLGLGIAVALASLLGAAWWTFATGAQARYAAAAPTSAAAAQEQCRRILKEMANELRLADPATVEVEPGRVRFRTRAGSEIAYAFAEGRLLRSQDGQDVAVMDGLRRDGFAATLDRGALSLGLTTLQGPPVQTAVALRR